MTASRQDVEAKLDASVADLKLTTSSGAKMVTQYGADPSKWPTSSHWYKAIAGIAAARAETAQLVNPAPTAPLTAAFSRTK